MTESTDTIPRRYNTTAIDIALVIDIALIAILWCTSIVIVNPVGNFPLLDDPIYGRTVRHLLETGEYRPEMASMTLISNVLWGSLFCLPGGFTFTALRLSTLSASLLCIFATYILVRDLQQPRWLAILVSLTVAFNPIYYTLSNTFDTDVTFTAIAIWAAVFFARCLKSGSDFQLLLGVTLAVAAILSRQLGLSIPVAFAATLLLKRGFTPPTVLRAIIPVLLPVGALLAFNHWLAISGRTPLAYDYGTNELLRALSHPAYLATHLLGNGFFALNYLGLFLLPVLLLSFKDILPSCERPATTAHIAVGVVTVALGAAVYIRYGGTILMPMPRSANILVKTGIGPLTLRDTFLLHLEHMPSLPSALWIIVTVIGTIGAVSLIAKLSVHARNLMPRYLHRRRIDDTEATGTFLVLCGIIYLLPVLIIPFTLCYDRYVIPSIPFLAAGIVGVSAQFAGTSSGHAKSLRLAAFALLAAFGLFAISGTRDYLAWNRVRWEALQNLMLNDHVDPEDIDGGFEFNCLYFFEPRYLPDEKVVKEFLTRPGRSPWWVHRDTYQIGFGGVPGYTIFKEYTYQHWLPPHVQKVVVLRKE
jgi:hypothetical protein